jgi:WD40 repeat protein
MRRFIFCIAPALALAGFVFVGMTAGIATAGSRIDSEDMVFSYAPESDHLVFGGVGYDSTLHEDMNHPDKSILYVQDLKTGTKTKVFEAASQYLGNPQVSPSGATIAVQASQDDRFTNPRLLVLTADGKEITSFAQGREFSWSPDSRFLAYTTGDVERIYTMRSTGTWLYDQRGKTTRKIFDKGHYLAWSQSDHSLYIWDESDARRHILRYDPITQKVVETNFHGISFSPTGRYYHGTRSSGIGTVDVFDSKTNQPFLSHRPRIAALMHSARIVGWAPEGDVLVLEANRQELRSEEHPLSRFDTVLYDVAHDIARVIPDDSVIGWQNGQAIVHDRGKFSKRALTALPLLPEKP